MILIFFPFGRSTQTHTHTHIHTLHHNVSLRIVRTSSVVSKQISEADKHAASLLHPPPEWPLRSKDVRYLSCRWRRGDRAHRLFVRGRNSTEHPLPIYFRNQIDSQQCVAALAFASLTRTGIGSVIFETVRTDPSRHNTFAPQVSYAQCLPVCGTLLELPEMLRTLWLRLLNYPKFRSRNPFSTAQYAPAQRTHSGHMIFAPFDAVATSS